MKKGLKKPMNKQDKQDLELILYIKVSSFPPNRFLKHSIHLN